MAYFGCIKKSSSPPTPPEPNYLYKWDFTKSLVDEVQGTTVELFNGATQNENGLNIKGQTQYAKLNIQFDKNNIYDFSVSTMNKKNTSMQQHGKLIFAEDDSYEFIYRGSYHYWAGFDYTWRTDDSGSPYNTEANVFANKILRIKWENNNFCVYADDEIIYRCSVNNFFVGKSILLGWTNGTNFYDITYTGLRVYKNEEV